MTYRLTRFAEGQIDAVLVESARVHGKAAASRYSLLLIVTMNFLAEAPFAVGSVAVSGLAGMRVYPLRLSRFRVDATLRVGSPRHLILYRVTTDDVVEVLGVVHDRMVLSRAARRAVRAASGQ